MPTASLKDLSVPINEIHPSRRPSVSYRPTLTSSPSITPTPDPPQSLGTVTIVPVSVSLTGVPWGANMTAEEQRVFETLMLDLLVPRLGSVEVTALEVAILSQEPDSLDGADAGAAAKEEDAPTLQLALELSIRYDTAPEVVRDWSFYLSAWIDSFGNTMVDILASPTHPQHPNIDSEFWENLSDISATNVDPPNTDPTATPTSAPTYIIYPDNSKSALFYVAIISGGIVAAFCVGCTFVAIMALKKAVLLEMLEIKKAHLEEEKSGALLRSLNLGDDQDIFNRPQNCAGDRSQRSQATSFDYTPAKRLSKTAVERVPSESEDSDSSKSTVRTPLKRFIEPMSDDSSDSESSSEEEEKYELNHTREDAVKKPLKSVIEEAYHLDSGYSDSSSDPSSKDILNQNRKNQKIDQELQEFDDVVERVLANDSSLEKINLDCKQINGNIHRNEALWNGLVSNTYVAHLSLRDCNITDDEVIPLSLALVENTTITHVCLGKDKFVHLQGC